jgi:hypothetical protein
VVQVSAELDPEQLTAPTPAAELFTVNITAPVGAVAPANVTDAVSVVLGVP